MTAKKVADIGEGEFIERIERLTKYVTAQRRCGAGQGDQQCRRSVCPQNNRWMMKLPEISPHRLRKMPKSRGKDALSMAKKVNFLEIKDVSIEFLNEFFIEPLG